MLYKTYFYYRVYGITTAENPEDDFAYSRVAIETKKRLSPEKYAEVQGLYAKALELDMKIPKVVPITREEYEENAEGDEDDCELEAEMEDEEP